jgi:CIC family chloride channel protein
MAVKMMALLCLLRLVSTPFCYGSGNAGGIFGPSLFLGAMLGGSVGGVAHALFPNSTATPGVYALVGMGTTFAGILRVPLTSVFMIFEITRDYAIIVPLMISNLISYYMSYRLQGIPIYEALAKQDGIHLPEHSRGRGGSLRVAQAMQTGAEAFPADMDASAARDAMQKLDVRSWPVRAQDGLLGMVTADQLEVSAGRTLADVVPPFSGNATSEDFPHVHTDHGLDQVLQRMGVAGLDVLPVVGRDQVRRMVGVVRLGDVLRVYGVRG